MTRLGHILAPAGISREMLLGAAVSGGAPVEPIADVVQRLGCQLTVAERAVGGLVATHAIIEALPGTGRADSLESIHRLIERAGVDPGVASGTVAVYERLISAEAILHGSDIASARLHQLGEARYPALIAATVAAFLALALDRITVGVIALGSGSIAVPGHGTLPVPAPATSHLLRGFRVIGGPGEGELTGPTAAALVAALTHPEVPVPEMTLEGIGRGAGRVDTARPGVATLLIGT